MAKSYRAAREPSDLKFGIGSRLRGLGLGTAIPIGDASDGREYDCLGCAASLERLLELVPQIRERRLLRFLNHGLLVCLRYLLAHDLDVVISTIVIIPNFVTGNRISDNEIEGLLHAGNNVCPG
jgi:hypothetical protein